MNHRERMRRPVPTHRTMRCFTLLLLPALAPGLLLGYPRDPRAIAMGRRYCGVAPLPYLPVLGAPALRFERTNPPPDLVTQPPAAAPPIPALSPTETVVAQENTAAALATEHPASRSVAAGSDSGGIVPSTKNTPSIILPDGSRPTVNAEDFLPFFQVPGSRATTKPTVIIPSPPAPSPGPFVPPSSATYTESPR